MAEGFGFYQKTPFLATLIRALHLLPLLLLKFEPRCPPAYPLVLSRLLFNPFSLAFLSYSVCRSFLLLPPSQEKDVFHVFLLENLESADRPLAFKAALISQLINLRIADFKA